MTNVVIDAESIDSLFAAFASTSEPGLVVGIGLHGTPVYRKGFGVASVELPAPLTPTTRMRIGSVSKQLSALAFLLLVEEGRVALDDSIRAFAPELPEHAEPVTLRHLLQHTGGLRCGLDILLSMAGIGVAMPAHASIDILGEQAAVQFAPGTGWSYNNSGYALVGSVIEQLAQQPLADVLRERLFRPLGMRDTLLRLVDTDLVPNSATLHVPSPGGAWTRGIFGPPIGAEGGIVSTLDDMLRWAANMRTPTIGSQNSWRAMREPAVLHSGHCTGYGMGLMLGQWRGHRLIHHAGGVVGGSAYLVLLPDVGVDLVLMTNRAAIDLVQLARDVLAACVPTAGADPAQPPLAPANGIFRAPESGMVIALATHESRRTVHLMGAPVPVRYSEDGAIALEADLGVAIRWPRGQTQPQSIEYVGLGGREILERVEPATHLDQSLLGEYASREAQARAWVTESDEGLRIETSSRYGTMTYKLQPLAHNLWSIAPLRAPVPFGGIIESDAAGFRFSTRRARRLRFERAYP